MAARLRLVGAISAVLTIFLAIGAPRALAQAKGKGGAAGAPAAAAAPGVGAQRASKATITNQGGKEHITFTDAAVITAQVQKPSVFFVIDHEELGNYQWESLKKNFLPAILQSVEQDPF